MWHNWVIPIPYKGEISVLSRDVLYPCNYTHSYIPTFSLHNLAVLFQIIFSLLRSLLCACILLNWYLLHCRYRVFCRDPGRPLIDSKPTLFILNLILRWFWPFFSKCDNCHAAANARSANVKNMAAQRGLNKFTILLITTLKWIYWLYSQYFNT